MLFGSNILEVAIGMMFVFLLLSLLCSAFSELIESFLQFRSRDLKKGINRLLNDPSLGTELLNHPLIKPLGENPSYIPARTFSLALWSIATNAGRGGITQDLSTIRKSISELDDKTYGPLKVPLLTLIDEAGNDIDKARTNIEEWYNDAMDRVSGWYKRRTHRILVVIGFLAASILNIDTINVARMLWYNDTMRTSIVSAANSYIEDQPAEQRAGQQAPADQGDPRQQAEAALDKIKFLRGEINDLGLPIGWVAADGNPANAEDPRRTPQSGYGWFLKFLGILFTALAVSQGAPFWFDLLNKFIVIRSTIKPREKSQVQPSKDRPAPDETEDEEGKN